EHRCVQRAFAASLAFEGGHDVHQRDVRGRNRFLLGRRGAVRPARPTICGRQQECQGKGRSQTGEHGQTSYSRAGLAIRSISPTYGEGIFCLGLTLTVASSYFILPML